MNRVRGKTAVADAFFQLSQMAPRVLVQRYIEWGHELLVGVQRDAKFGLVLACGRGGTDVEQRADARFRLWPLDAADQDELASDVVASLPARDAEERAALQATLVELLAATSRLVAAHPTLQEADLNPVKLSAGDGAMVVDARLRVSDNGSS